MLTNSEPLLRRKWEEFKSSPAPRSGRRFYVSLNEKGIIVMNRKTYAALGEPEAVSLLYDMENLSIGIRASTLLMPNAFPVAPRGRSGTQVIWAKTFVNAYRIWPTSTIRFLTPEIEDDTLILDLKHTARTTQSPRTGWRKKPALRKDRQ